MGKRRKRRREQSKPDSAVDPRVLQIIQRKIGGRRLDRAKTFRTLIQEAQSKLEQSNLALALALTNEAERLAQSEDEHSACDALQAEIYFQRGSRRDPEPDLGDLELAALLAPNETRYRVQLARALEQTGRIDKALEHYRSATTRSDDSRVGFLWSVAAMKAGNALPDVDLAPAERNTLNAVRAIASQEIEAVSFEEPLLGNSSLLWQALARMDADPDATPEQELRNATSALDGTRAAGISSYYLGVAALRAGDTDTAWQAMRAARDAGYTSPWLEDNLSYLARAQAVQYAEDENWQKVVDVGAPVLRQVDDRILAETVSLAYFHLGYAAAQAGDWDTSATNWEQAVHHSSNRYLAQNLALVKEQYEDWIGAAEAWRDMVRRRPRREDHPDYIDDNQVAGVWRHAAECYHRAETPSEAVTCLQNALKYAPDDVEIRHELSSALLANEQLEAAENELDRILARDPDNVKALVRLGELYATDNWNWWRYGGRAIKLLKRALELEPNHAQAREVLGDFLVEQADRALDWGMYEEARKEYRRGLEHLPDYAPLHASLGLVERLLGHAKAAREHLLKAYELDPSRVETVGQVLHELLHVDEAKVEELLPEIPENLQVLPQFWINQAGRVLECELEEGWAEDFFDKALALADEPGMPATRATVLLDIILELTQTDAVDSALGWQYRRQIDREVPDSGVREILDAARAVSHRSDFAKAERLLAKARKKARKAGEDMLLERIDMIDDMLFAGPFGPLGLGGMLDDFLDL